MIGPNLQPIATRHLPCRRGILAPRRRPQAYRQYRRRGLMQQLACPMFCRVMHKIGVAVLGDISGKQPHFLGLRQGSIVYMTGMPAGVYSERWYGWVQYQRWKSEIA